MTRSDWTPRGGLLARFWLGWSLQTLSDRFPPRWPNCRWSGFLTCVQGQSSCLGHLDSVFRRLHLLHLLSPLQWFCEFHRFCCAAVRVLGGLTSWDSSPSLLQLFNYAADFTNWAKRWGHLWPTFFHLNIQQHLVQPLKVDQLTCSGLLSPPRSAPMMTSEWCWAWCSGLWLRCFCSHRELMIGSRNAGASSQAFSTAHTCSLLCWRQSQRRHNLHCRHSRCLWRLSVSGPAPNLP